MVFGVSLNSARCGMIIFICYLFVPNTSPILTVVLNRKKNRIFELELEILSHLYSLKKINKKKNGYTFLTHIPRSGPLSELEQGVSFCCTSVICLF